MIKKKHRYVYWQPITHKNKKESNILNNMQKIQRKTLILKWSIAWFWKICRKQYWILRRIQNILISWYEGTAWKDFPECIKQKMKCSRKMQTNIWRLKAVDLKWSLVINDSLKSITKKGIESQPHFQGGCFWRFVYNF